jgi:hypothetical protein
MSCGSAARGADNAGVPRRVFWGDSARKSVSSLGIDHDAHIGKGDVIASVQGLLFRAGQPTAQA